MRKIFLFLFAVALFAAPMSAFACGHEEMEGDMGKGMHAMMMKKMERTVVATSDGGVVILSGNKMTKYDRNLRVVKETDLPMDDMMKIMGEMKHKCAKGCPMMNKKGAEKEEAKKPENPADHAAHH